MGRFAGTAFILTLPHAHPSATQCEECGDDDNLRFRCLKSGAVVACLTRV